MTSVEMVRLSPSGIDFEARFIVHLIDLVDFMAWKMDSKTIG